MKKFISFSVILAMLVGCGGSSDKGELVGVKGKKWHPEKPYGMTLVPEAHSLWENQTMI